MMTADYKGAADRRRQKRILIVGAGASGLMAALSAAHAGAEVTVLEHKQEAGIKLALTGNGRCNYTNTDVASDKYHYGDEAGRRFIEAVLMAFSYKDCIDFFESLGIEPEIRHYSYDESGYAYPKGMNAVSFRDVMYQAALSCGVHFRFGVSNAEVIKTVLSALGSAHDDKSAECDNEAEDCIDLSRNNALRTTHDDAKACGEIGNDACGERCDDAGDNACDAYDAVIIAAGSNAYPVTGSDSSIYPVFRELGISLNRFLPALCALYSKDEHLKAMKGRRVKSKAALTIYDEAEQTSVDDSRAAGRYMDADGRMSSGCHTDTDIHAVADNREGAVCNMAADNRKDAVRHKDADNRTGAGRSCGKPIAAYTQSGEIQFNEHSISGIPVMQLSGYAAKALKDGKCAVLSIDGHDYVIHRTAGFDRAQTCTGGIDPAYIDPHTMRYIGSAADSAIDSTVNSTAGSTARNTANSTDTQNAANLYLCGEIIDIDGECGGYNLHFAWATGYTAGKAAAGANNHACIFAGAT